MDPIEPYQNYRYTPLDDTSRDIRLVNLHPGEFDEGIRLEIFHTAIPTPSSADTRLSLQEIQETVNPPWIARETLVGQFLFKNKSLKPAVWYHQHPNPSFDPTKYKISEKDTHTSNTAISYEALSYTWGSEQANVPIWIGPSSEAEAEMRAPSGYSNWMALSVRLNLFTALRHLRHKKNSRVLWIDAICINQNDHSERSKEVLRIGTIFALAQRVIAFLGPETNSSTHAIQSLRYLGEQVELFLSLGAAVRCAAPGAIEKRWYRRDEDLGYSEDTWIAIFDLLKQEWFKRLWIVQEIFVANYRAIILCGREAISLSLFRRALTTLDSKEWLPSGEARIIVRYVHRMIDVREGLSLRNVLGLGDGRRCADLRDRVYALCGIMAPKFRAKIEIDYSKEIGEVFAQMTQAHIQHLCRLELFGLCYQTRRTLPMPSWVPDLTLQSKSVRLGLHQFASGFSRAHFTFLPQGILQVLGLRCGVIDQVFGPLDENCEDFIGKIKTWQPADPSSPYPTGETLAIAQAITLRTNRFAHRHPGVRRISLDDWLAELSIEGFWDMKYVHEGTNTQPDFSRAIDLAKDQTYGHTMEGYVGLAPPDSRIGTNTWKLTPIGQADSKHRRHYCCTLRRR